MEGSDVVLVNMTRDEFKSFKKFKEKNNMTNPNDPAGPFINYLGNDGLWETVYCGLTKREVFAVAAHQGLLANPNSQQYLSAADLAKMAVTNADLLIAALNQSEE